MNYFKNGMMMMMIKNETELILDNVEHMTTIIQQSHVMVMRFVFGFEMDNNKRLTIIITKKHP